MSAFDKKYTAKNHLTNEDLDKAYGDSGRVFKSKASAEHWADGKRRKGMTVTVHRLVDYNWNDVIRVDHPIETAGEKPRFSHIEIREGAKPYELGYFASVHTRDFYTHSINSTNYNV